LLIELREYHSIVDFSLEVKGDSILSKIVKKPRTVKGFATLCAQLAADKKAENILILNLSNIESAPADYFVICTALSDTQVNAVASNVLQGGKEAGGGTAKSEGWDSTNWIIVDFFDVVVHVMHPDAREFYKLEKLWSDAEFFMLTEDSKVKALKDKSTKKVSELEITE
jgi:ribosome-associated protein